MKRIALFALLAAFVFGSVATASALDLKVKGDWRVHANFTDNLKAGASNKSFDNNTKNTSRTPEDDYNVYQRARVWFDFVANENLKAVLGIEIGNVTWGDTGGGQLGADGVNLKTKHAYLQFNVPNTKVNVTAGIQAIALPNTFGSAILDDDMAALVVKAPVTDNVTTLFGYTRLANLDGANSAGSKADDEVDALFLAAPVKFSGYEFNPFFLMAFIGKDFARSNASYAIGTSKNIYGASGPSFYPYLANRMANANSLNSIDGTTLAWWAGLNAKATAFDPFVFMFDFNYGSIDWKNPTGTNVNKAKVAGWYLDFAVDYKMSFMTPELFFFYGSGEDDKWLNGSERMPSVAPHFVASDIMFDGSQFDAGNSYINTNPFGLMGIGLKLKDISFVEKLKHNITIMYLQGTNDKKSVTNFKGVAGAPDYRSSLINSPDYGFYLTTKDSAWEVNVNTQYMVYDNLAAIVELGYMNLKYDKNTWNTSGTNDYTDKIKADAWRAALGFRYRF